MQSSRSQSAVANSIGADTSSRLLGNLVARAVWLATIASTLLRIYSTGYSLDL
jgi:hypothetical protein